MEIKKLSAKKNNNGRIKGGKNGRPYAITKEKEEILINLLSDGMSQAKACQCVGISEETIIQHKKRFPEFTERLEKSMLETHKLAHKSVRVGMLKDWRAGAWWLERTEPERFKERKNIDYGDKPILIEGMFPIDNDSE